jgi:hypothetical protein
MGTKAAMGSIRLHSGAALIVGLALKYVFEGSIYSNALLIAIVVSVYTIALSIGGWKMEIGCPPS